MAAFNVHVASTPGCRVALPFFAILLSVIAWGAGQEPKLVYTAILYRHGDRSPVSEFPSDKVPMSFWYEGLGQLSEDGMRQHYYLGQLFRQRYSTELHAEYLFNNYTRTQIYVRSTDWDRTLMSAQCQLSSLFMPDAAQRFIPDLNWQPIPVHTVPTAEDDLLMGIPVDCPTYKKLRHEIPESSEYKKISAEYKDFLIQLQNWTGEAEVNMSNIYIIADVVYVQYVHNLTKYQPWATPEVRANLSTLSIYAMKWLFDSMEKSRLACGNLVNKIVDEMHMKVNGSCKEEKIHFFSAHDTTVACLLSALGVFDMRYPKYTSSVIVEFYRRPNGEYYVDLWYKYGPMVKIDGKLYCNSNYSHPYNKTVECLEPLMVPGCSSQQCPFKEFVTAISGVSPKDWKSECGLGSEVAAEQVCGFGIAMTVVSGALLLLVVGSVIGIICYSRRKRMKYQPLDTSTN